MATFRKQGNKIRAEIAIKGVRKSKSFKTKAEAHHWAYEEEQKIEVTIPTKHRLIRAEESSNDMYVAIDLVSDIIEKQIKKYKNKLIDKKQAAASFSDLFINYDEEDKVNDDIQIVKFKKFDIKPMTAEEACLQMEMLGHSFYVFVNAETETTAVVYKRKNNTYGLIEAEY